MFYLICVFEVCDVFLVVECGLFPCLSVVGFVECVGCCDFCLICDTSSFKCVCVCVVVVCLFHHANVVCYYQVRSK